MKEFTTVTKSYVDESIRKLGVKTIQEVISICNDRFEDLYNFRVSGIDVCKYELSLIEIYIHFMEHQINNKYCL
jgi:hypothetical protein